MPAPRVGDTVHFVFPETLEHRAAIITAIYPGVDEVVNLQVFVDGQNDIPLGTPVGPILQLWRKGVPHDPTAQRPASWHEREQ